MKKNKFIYLAFILILAITATAGLFIISPSAETFNGTTGEALSWTLNTDTGLLEISGSGSMPNYTLAGTLPPWYNLRHHITSIKINEGISNIGDYAFANFGYLNEISIPNSVRRIGEYAFYRNAALKEIIIPQGVTWIDNYAFADSVLITVTIPESVTEIGRNAFVISSLKTVYYTGTKESWNAVKINVTNTKLLELDIIFGKFTVTWDVDGKETKEVYKSGVTPAFSGSTAKLPTEQLEYTFTGWDNALTAVKKDITYKAVYTSSARKYTVTWIVDGNKTTEQYEYNKTPVFSGNTDLAATAKFTYTFIGWDKDPIAVTGDITYEAKYISVINKYTVTWDIDGIKTTEEYEYDASPHCPVKIEKDPDEFFVYKFDGWDKEITKVTGDVTYTGTYTKIAIEQNNPSENDVTNEATSTTAETNLTTTETDTAAETPIGCSSVVGNGIFIILFIGTFAIIGTKRTMLK